MTNSYKKESPLAGFAGFGGGAPGLSYKSAATKIYVDEVFSTQTYIGNDSNRSFVNGLDLATEGGLVWSKSRTGSSAMLHLLFDTERGVTKDITSQSTGAEGTSSTIFTAFNTDGYSVGTSAYTNENNSEFASWSFRKSEGFFDVIKYTGTGSTQNISHSLGSAPGCIFVKNLSSSIDWAVWHRASAEIDATNTLKLNTDGTESTNNTYFDDGGTPPTATQFTVHTSNRVNASGSEYIAYVFAGGASTAATARSVYHDGGDLQFSASSDLQLGTGDFTVEGWFNPFSVSGTPCIFDFRSTTGSTTDGFAAFLDTSTGKLGLYTAGGWICNNGVASFRNQWYHFAAVKSSGTIKLYVNGTQNASAYTTSTNFTNNTLRIGSGATGANVLTGWVSNFRVVKGTALYTSSFRPPTEPLTNVTNTKLLCCNNSSVTGGTVLPNTPSVNNSVTAKTDSPFDDPEGFKFGGDGEGIIKCGIYKGNGDSAGPEIDLGWEPQWVMVKSNQSTGNWFMFDSMRGIITDGYDAKFAANESNNEENDTDWLDLNPTGFQLKSTNSNVNADHTPYIYMAIRRPDGGVAKPAAAGTDVFAMDYGSGSSNIPTFDSGFPVDFSFYRIPTQAQDYTEGARLTGTKYLLTNATNSEADNAYHLWDSNLGWSKGHSSSYLSWMWKRGPGFDAVTYEGNSDSTRIIRHSLGAAPDMIWVKNRDTSTNWLVGHHGLNEGTNPWNHYIYLNTSDASGEYDFFANKAPTAYSFEVSTAIANDTNNLSLIHI